MTDAGRKPVVQTQTAPAAALDLASAFQHLPFQRLKFVSNDGQPHAKRRRIAAAYVFPFVLLVALWPGADEMG